MRTAIFVITLERSIERRAHAEWIVSNGPIASELLVAVDGTALGNDVVAEIHHRHIYTPRYPHSLSRGEIGCFLSHRRAWKAIIDRQLDAALILEDDVTFDPQLLKNALYYLENHTSPGDYIQFQVRDVAVFREDAIHDEHHWLVQPCPVMLRTTAQFVTHDAARRLLDATQHFDRPVDTFLQMTWVTGVTVKVIQPCVVREISNQIGGSTLSRKRRPWYERLRREIMRPIYRAQIRHQSRKAS